MMRRLLTVSFIVLLQVALSVSAGAETVSRLREPIEVSADRLEADLLKNQVVFSGRVTARQGDVAIHAETMTVVYITGDKGDVERAEFSGDVRIVQNDRIATADRGVFHNREGQVVLSGHAEVHEMGSSVAGDEIVYYLNEARSVISSQTDSRVNAVFRPQGGAQ